MQIKPHKIKKEYKLLNSKNKKILLIVLILLFAVVGVIVSFFFLTNNKQNLQTQDDKLQTIDAYQERYFEIIKRHDALLTMEMSDEVKEDYVELKSLFAEVKGKVNLDCPFLSEYEKLKFQFMNNSGQNTYEMNEFASKKFDAFDKLLNETYKAVKEKLSEEDFDKLRQSQRAWLKEVEDYNSVFVSKGFGTIGALVKYDYETNMRCFRTLLIMMYL